MLCVWLSLNSALGECSIRIVITNINIKAMYQYRVNKFENKCFPEYEQ